MTRKNILLTTALIFLGLSIQAQFRIIEKGEIGWVDGVQMQIVPGGTEDFSETTQPIAVEADASTYKLSVWVVNQSETTYNVMCRRIEADVLPGTENNTCWNQCPILNKLAGVEPDWIVGGSSSPLIEIMAPGDTISSFEQKYLPNNITGCSTFELRFENADNPGEVLTSFNIEFGTADCLVDGVEEIGKVEALKMFPNPANEDVQLDLTSVESEVSITVTNLLGEVVAEFQNVVGGRLFALETSKWNNGIYAISILENGATILSSQLSVLH